MQSRRFAAPFEGLNSSLVHRQVSYGVAK